MFFRMLFASNRRRFAPPAHPGNIAVALNPLVFLCHVRM